MSLPASIAFPTELAAGPHRSTWFATGIGQCGPPKPPWPSSSRAVAGWLAGGRLAAAFRAGPSWGLTRGPDGAVWPTTGKELLRYDARGRARRRELPRDAWVTALTTGPTERSGSPTPATTRSAA